MSSSQEEGKTPFQPSSSSYISSIESQEPSTHRQPPLDPPPSTKPTSELQEELNKIPPELCTAEFHGIINKVWLTQRDKEVLKNDAEILRTEVSHISKEGQCVCCKNKLGDLSQVERFTFWTGIQTFKIFGTGVPMYFYFMIFLMILFLSISFVVSIPTITLNIIEDEKDELGVRSPSFLVYTSIGNHGITASNFRKSFSIDSIIALNMLGTLIIFLGYRIYRCMSLKKASQIDEETITPSDFTIFAMNIKRDVSKKQIQDHLEEKYNAQNIKEVILCYDINRAVELLRKRKQEERRLASFRLMYSNVEDPSKLRKKICCYEKHVRTERQIQERIDKLTEEIEECKKVYENPERDEDDEFCGKAFIILNNQNEATRLNEELHIKSYKRIFKYVWNKLICCRSNSRGKFNIVTQRASEPTDVFWENLPITSRVRFTRSAISFFAMFFLLLFSFCCNLVFGIFKDHLERKYDNSGKAFQFFNFIMLMLLNALNSLVISFFNVSLKHLGKILTEYERHDSYTSYTLSLTVKMVVSMYINTAIIPLCINYQEKYWFAGTGLIADIFYNTIAICFISPLLYFYDPKYLLKVCKRKREIKKGERSKLTQRQFNELFEGQDISLENRYTSAFLIILVCSTYTVLLPILPIICFFGILYQYCLVKYMLVKYNSRPREIGYIMDISASNILILVILVNGCSIWYFLTRLSDGENFFAWIPLLIASICILLPISYIEKKLNINKVTKSDRVTYESIDSFDFTYKTCNPVELDGKISIARLEKYAGKDKLKQNEIIWGDLLKDVTEALKMSNQKASLLPPKIKKNFSAPNRAAPLRKQSKTQDLTVFERPRRFTTKESGNSSKEALSSLINSAQGSRKWSGTSKTLTKKFDEKEEHSSEDRIITPGEIILETKKETPGNWGKDKVMDHKRTRNGDLENIPSEGSQSSSSEDTDYIPESESSEGEEASSSPKNDSTSEQISSEIY
ncbi:unnamed protein product [Moneuplotes crassus]|uniref:CSC1/OSCA1-like cytosolic domain-containing protein n=1 Tax=Euplotes crassus TaxID=5936 RepID=A0AAD2D6A7_EUPCR|nr:unnamed protein product [Moneuplotes crassus]